MTPPIKAGQRGRKKQVRETHESFICQTESGTRFVYLGWKMHPVAREGDKVRVTVTLLARTRKGR